MRKNLLLAIAFSFGIWAYLLLLAAAPRRGSASNPDNLGPEDGMVVLFSPGGHCTDAVVSEIAQANLSLDIQAYSFTSPPIAQAVLDAFNRGVHVRVILDKNQRTESASCANFLSSHRIPVFIDDQHAMAHNKVILIDGKVLIDGSFNLTKAAEDQNAENLQILRYRPTIIAAYASNFEHHLNHSIPYVAPEDSAH